MPRYLRIRWGYPTLLARMCLQLRALGLMGLYFHVGKDHAYLSKNRYFLHDWISLLTIGSTIFEGKCRYYDYIGLIHRAKYACHELDALSG